MTTLPKSAQEFFDVQMVEALKQNPEKAREVNAVYYFNITGTGGGEWTLDLTATPPAVTQGNAGNAQCSIEIAAEDFLDMLRDPALGMQLYFQGKLKVAGDPMLAMKLQQIFTLGGT